MAKIRILRRVDRTGVQTVSEYDSLAAAVEAFQYTLETGAAYSKEEGCYKIVTCPRSAMALVKNLNRAVDNAAANGYAGVTYSLA